MSQECPHPYGLRLTLRHQMIGVVYFALIFAIYDILRKRGGADVRNAIVACTLLLSPWILGVLALALDRPGPMRNWMVTSLFTLFSPALALYHDWVTGLTLWRTGTIPSPLTTMLLNTFFLGSYAVYWRAMGPQQCPTCRRWALIPLIHLWGQTRRTEKTRWCAACGDLVWRIGRGPWQKERRRTWLDKPVDPLAGLDDEPACPVAAGAGSLEAAPSCAVVPVAAAEPGAIRA